MAGALVFFMRSEHMPPGRLFRFGRGEIDDYRAFIGRLSVAVGRRP
jgi:hypothetical protein